MTNVSLPPAGWYPDPAGTPRQRWWDGTTWTENYHDALAAARINQQTVPEGTPVYTNWVWAIAGALLLGLLSLFAVDWEAYMEASLATVPDPTALFVTSGYLFSLAIGWISTALVIIFAWLDTRELKARGIAKPFSWLYTLLGIAFGFAGIATYFIGRAVVLKRLTGRGMATVWILVGYVVVSIIVGIGLFMTMFNATMNSMPGFTSP